MSAAALKWAAGIAGSLRRPERLLVEALAARAGHDGYGQATTAELEVATGYVGRGAVNQAARAVGELLRDAGGMLAWHPQDGGGYRYHYRVPPEGRTAVRAEPPAAQPEASPAAGPLGVWVLLELLEAREEAGWLTETTLAGTRALRLEVPAVEGRPARVVLTTPASVYAVHVVDEATVRRVVATLALPSIVWQALPDREGPF